MKEFENPFYIKNYHTGNLIVGSDVVGKARVDIEFNEFDTNNISVRITDVEWTEKARLKSINEEEKLEFFLETEDSIVSIHLDENWLFPFSESNTTARQYQLSTDEQYSNAKFDRLHDHVNVCYIFPLIHLFEFRRGTTFLDNRGYFRGYPDDKEMKSFKWTDEVIEFNTSVGEFKFYDSMNHKEIENDDLQHSLVISRRTKLFFDICEKKESFKEIEDQSREKARIIFLSLSLIEGASIDWQIEKLSIVNKCGLTIKDRKTYHWAMLSKQGTLLRSQGLQYIKELRSCIPEIVDRYVALGKEEQKMFDYMMNAYKLACIAKAIEVQLIYWHSCLDFLKKRYGFGGANQFSEKLIKTCTKESIAWDDLGFQMSKNKSKVFRFNEIRNQYLHDGFLVDDYDEILNEMRKMKALTERLILKHLGIDYSKTKIGFPYP